MGASTSTLNDASAAKAMMLSTPQKTKEASPTGRVIAFHSSSKWKAYFEASKQTSKLLVIDFTASWCGPCKYIQPAVDEFAQVYKDVDIVKIDVDELEDVAQEFGVQALPCFIMVKKGKEVDKVVGAKKQDLKNKIDKLRFSN